jgi:hypothetical protein
MSDYHAKHRQDTHDKIRRAIVRLEQQRPQVVNIGRKISVAAVAEEAGVSRSLIHNDYPDLLERIRGNSNKQIQAQRNRKHEALKKVQEKNRQLLELNKELTKQLDALASKNASLTLEIRRLQAIISSDNVAIFKGKNT